ncbi:MAG: IS630 family transposase [Planctomycetes bacterium]|jgi:transposase|nr:IS630 family transposase [Planctomycetota bacterium]
MRIAPSVTVTNEQRPILESWARGRSTPVRLMQRAKIVLLAADGQENKDIAAQIGTTPLLVGRWRKRFVKLGLPGIVQDAPGRGRKPVARDAVATKIIEWTTQRRPENATHWSTRTLAAALGTSDSMVRRVWQANGLKPHLSRTFKLSNDPRFVEKLVDVVGLYLNPPEHALVLSCDEKSQIQALDRTQPGLPIKPGRCGTMTHDYKRNGTTTLFAALELAEGKLIGTCMKRHRHQEWIKFLKLVDAQTPAELDLHLIADNYFTHKTPEVQRWLKRHPRFHMHFIPTSSSWLNMVERWFREITDKRIRRQSFTGIEQLIDVIMDYIAKHNQNPKTFVWTAKVEDIMAKVARARAVLNNVQTN